MNCDILIGMFLQEQKWTILSLKMKISVSDYNTHHIEIFTLNFQISNIDVKQRFLLIFSRETYISDVIIYCF